MMMLDLELKRVNPRQEQSEVSMVAGTPPTWTSTLSAPILARAHARRR